MKNKYLTKCLCMTIISAMVLSGPAAVFAASDGGAFESGEQIDDSYGEVVPTAVPEPTQAPTVEPTQAPTEPTQAPVEPTQAPVEPTQAPAEPTQAPKPTHSPTATPTQTPSSPSATPTQAPEATPTPGTTDTPEITSTPVPSEAPVSEAVRDIIDRIDALSLLEDITLDQKDEIHKIRKAYDALSDSEKSLVSNYQLFLNMEKKLKKLEDTKEKEEKEKKEAEAIEGDPLYYTDMVSNLHAGKDFYLNSLQDNYQLSFSDDFASVMDEIEKEYKAKNKLADVSDTTGGVTSSADTLLVRNWQDILAVYIYEQSQQGVTSYILDGSCKAALADIFARMNPVIRDSSDITKVSYGNYHINHYIKENKIPKDQRAVLKKYTETDCSLLCAVVTAAKGFVRESVGDSVSEERVNVITSAYSLIGKVGYFWGGKSLVLGEDPSWGTVETVTAEGSKSTGTRRAYGLDCSGFVTWAVVNGYQNQAMEASVGNGTSDQWGKANVVSEADAQPGDLVFQKGPEAGVNNHVGILCGKTEAGDWIAVHCSASQNGVTVGEAYSASFRYIRQPSFYPTIQQAAQMAAQGAQNSNTQYFVTDVKVTNTLQDIIKASQNVYDPANQPFTSEGNAQVVVSDVTVNNALSDLLQSQTVLEETEAGGQSVFDVIAECYPPEDEAAAGPSGDQEQAEEAGIPAFVSEVYVDNSLENVLDTGTSTETK